MVEAPEVAAKTEPGHFVIVMADERGERIPLTIADSDAKAGTVTLVLMVVGASSRKLSKLRAGDSLYALIGPLGHASEIDHYGEVILVAGGVGDRPGVSDRQGPQRQRGNKVTTIQGARTASLLFWCDRLAAVSDRHIITTDDGSQGRKGLVTAPLKELLESNGRPYGCVYAIGPAIMMKFCRRRRARSASRRWPV